MAENVAVPAGDKDLGEKRKRRDERKRKKKKQEDARPSAPTFWPIARVAPPRVS
jgi:hypothetical protein